MLDGLESIGPDLTLGLPCDELAERAIVLGHVEGEQVLLTRVDSELFAVSRYC